MDELERIARAERAFSPEDLERFRGVMARKELSLAEADLEEARILKEAALEERERLRREYERVTEDLEAALTILARVKERARRAAKIVAGEE